MRHAFAIVFVLLFCTPAASAALLAEITWTNPTPLALPETWHFLALNYAEGIDPPGEIWTSELPRDGQFGERLIADAATVARLNSKLTWPTRQATPSTHFLKTVNSDRAATSAKPMQDSRLIISWAEWTSVGLPAHSICWASLRLHTFRNWAIPIRP